MILYLCLGLLLIAAGVVSVVFSEYHDLGPWLSSMMFIIPLVIGGAMSACALFNSNKEVDSTSNVTKVTIEEGGKKSLLTVSGDIISCPPDNQICLDARIGDLVVYSTKWHESGLWVERQEVILATKDPR